MGTSPSARKPALARWFFSLLASASFFGANNLVKAEVRSRTFETVSGFLRMASAWAARRFCGFLISSKRSRARGLAAAMYSRANQATAANSPKIASGMKSASVNSGVEAAANMAYTLISTIFLITTAPRICMTTATASIFFPAGSVKSCET